MKHSVVVWHVNLLALLCRVVPIPEQSCAGMDAVIVVSQLSSRTDF